MAGARARRRGRHACHIRDRCQRTLDTRPQEDCKGSWPRGGVGCWIFMLTACCAWLPRNLHRRLGKRPGARGSRRWPSRGSLPQRVQSRPRARLPSDRARPGAPARAAAGARRAGADRARGDGLALRADRRLRVRAAAREYRGRHFVREARSFVERHVQPRRLDPGSGVERAARGHQRHRHLRARSPPDHDHQADHFRSRHVGLSCSAAPIHDSTGA